MSKHHHGTVETVHRLTHDVETMSNDELTQTYGIQFNEDGSVTDPTYIKTFKSIYEWVEFEAEQDELQYAYEDDSYDHW